MPLFGKKQTPDTVECLVFIVSSQALWTTMSDYLGSYFPRQSELTAAQLIPHISKILPRFFEFGRGQLEGYQSNPSFPTHIGLVEQAVAGDSQKALPAAASFMFQFIHWTQQQLFSKELWLVPGGPSNARAHLLVIGHPSNTGSTWLRGTP